MGQPTQVTGTAAESAAAAATNGFLGWSPDSNRAVYTVGSGSTNKKGAAEVPDATTRIKQFNR
jgi:hypothetical protein